MGEKKPSKFTVDDLSDVTVFRELEKMKKFILDNIYGKLIAGMQFDYGVEEEPNKVTLTITFNDETSVSASFEMNTIENITTETEGDVLYLVVTMTNGASYRCPIDTSEFVTIGGNQTVTGDKLFTGDVQVPDIEHEEEEEQIQETNKAVNERTLKIYATERIDSLEDEMGDVGQEGTVRGDLATLKNDMTQAKEDIVSAFDDIRYLDENKQTKLVGGTNIKNINNHDIMGGGNLQTQWGELEGSIADQNDLQTALDEKQPNLVSGQNLKTVNGVSLLGSGDVPIATGGTWGSIGGEIGNQNDLIQMFNTKQDTLVSGTNIKTVGGESLMGSGDISAGLIKTPSTFTELMTAFNGGKVIGLYIKTQITSSISSWTERPSSADVTTSSYGRNIILIHKRGTSPHTITSRISNVDYYYVSVLDIIYANDSGEWVIGLSGHIFNGGGVASLSSDIYIKETNYSTHIDLTKSFILG